MFPECAFMLLNTPRHPRSSEEAADMVVEDDDEDGTDFSEAGEALLMVSASNRYISMVPFSVVMRIIFEFGEKQNSSS